MPYEWRTELPGIFARHADSCPRRNGSVCVCGPLGYRASIVDPVTGRRSLSPDFETIEEAQAWQRGQHEIAHAPKAASHNGGLELGAVIDEFLQSAEDGRARDRRGIPYTPERIRVLRGALSYVDSALGSTHLEDVRQRHVQGMLDQLRASGTNADRLTSIAAALRSLYAYAIQHDLVGYSPVVELALPRPDDIDPRADAQASSDNGRDTLSAVVAQAPPPADPHAVPPAAYAAPPTAYADAPPAYHSEVAVPTAVPMERVMWWAIKVVVLLFALIALVLVAESV